MVSGSAEGPSPGPSPTSPPAALEDDTPSSGGARSPTAGSAQRPRPKLVYILGTGRCGSTVFEIVLASHPELQSMGEFYGKSFPRWNPGAICSCGQPYDRCAFWSPILQEYRKCVDFDRQSEGQLLFEAYRGLPRTLLYGMLRVARVREHARGLSDLVRVVAGASRKSVVTDSSKNALRGYLYSLARSPELDVYFVHLVRDGRGYMYSKTTLPDGIEHGRSRRVVSPWEITARWVVPNLLGTLLCSRPGNRYLRVRYEDFVDRPTEVLERVGRFIGVDMAPVIQAVRDRRPIPTHHLIGGNRLRFRPTITLESRFASVALSSRQSRWAFWVVGGWMAFWYGYRPAGHAPGPGTVAA